MNAIHFPPGSRGRFVESKYLPAIVSVRRGSVACRDLPNGQALYAACLKFHTGSQRTADDIHATGLAEVKRPIAEYSTRFYFCLLAFDFALSSLSCRSKLFLIFHLKLLRPHLRWRAWARPWRPRAKRAAWLPAAKTSQPFWKRSSTTPSSRRPRRKHSSPSESSQKLCTLASPTREPLHTRAHAFRQPRALWFSQVYGTFIFVPDKLDLRPCMLFLKTWLGMSLSFFF